MAEIISPSTQGEPIDLTTPNTQLESVSTLYSIQPQQHTHSQQENDTETSDHTRATSPHSIVSDISNPSQYRPRGVKKIISQGHCLIGLLDDKSVLKYASDPNNKEYQKSIRVESALLQLLGPHPHIIEWQGLYEEALKLKFYPQGTLRKYLTMNPHVEIRKRLKWCRQLAETIEFVHSKRVIHCDICLHNVLLDDDLNVVLADFQGVFKSITGAALLDGLTRECSKAYMPRSDIHYASTGSDLFALGSAIYHIMVGHEVFPELSSLRDAEEIKRRFESQLFPGDNYVASHIVEKCWKGEYRVAAEIIAELDDMELLAQAVEAEGAFGVG